MEKPDNPNDEELYRLYTHFINDVRRILKSVRDGPPPASYDETFAPMSAKEFAERMANLRQDSAEYQAFVAKVSNGAFSSLSPQNFRKIDTMLQQIIEERSR